MRRGQAALEYVVTYGWAFLVILVAVGAPSYFGVISPSNWIPEKCDFGNQLECVDFQLENNAGTDTVRLYLRNSFGKNITLTSARMRVEDQDMALNGAFPINVAAGATSSELELTESSSGSFREGAKQQVIVEINFTKTVVLPETAPEHTITGVIYAKVR